MTSTGAPLLQAKRIEKSFGSVHALRGADFSVNRGQVVALVGDNGAGKSTLVEALSGNLPIDSGEIIWEGRGVTLESSTHARSLGIEIVHQDLALAPDLDAATNLYLGRELYKTGILGRFGFLDDRAMRKAAAETFERLGVKLRSITLPIGDMSGGQRQGVAVARSVNWASKVLFLDEPTAALGIVQRKNVLDLIRRVRDDGVGVILITHNLPEVLEVADAIVVMRLGESVGRFSRDECTVDDIVAAMTGAVTVQVKQ
jgi:simple sugar transport system ATP-binding protein